MITWYHRLIIIHYHLDLSASDWRRSAVSTEYFGCQWLPVLDSRLHMNECSRAYATRHVTGEVWQLHQQKKTCWCFAELQPSTSEFTWLQVNGRSSPPQVGEDTWACNMQQRIIKACPRIVPITTNLPVANRLQNFPSKLGHCIAVRVTARKDKSSAVGRHCAIFASIAPKQS